MMLSVTPKILLPSVWPLPLSLATTRGISVDVFSSPYLDVSVQAVPFLYLFCSVQDTLRWVSPFGNLRLNAHLQLPEAYRSLSRPSSAPDAKAFPLRSYELDLSSKSNGKFRKSSQAYAPADLLPCHPTSPPQIQTRLRWALNLFRETKGRISILSFNFSD